MAVSIKNITVKMTLDTSDFQRGVNQAERSLNNLEKTGNEVGGSLRNAFAGIAIGAAIQQTLAYADSITSLQNKLNAFSTSQSDANARLDVIAGIAERSRGGLAEVGDLYVKISNNAAQMGVSQAQASAITETFAKALKVGGATAAETASATLQFAQAMGSGVLRGEEFNAIYEASPDTMNKLAAALGVPIKDMRKLAEEGKLTSDVVAIGFLRMQQQVESQFAKTAPTVSESFTQIGNSFALLLNNIEQTTGLFSGLASALKFVADNFVLVGSVALIAFGPQLVGAIKTATVAMRAFALSNPFTAIALAIGVAIAWFASFAESVGGVGNAFKMMGNAAIGVINGLYNGFTAYFTFMGNALGALGRAFLVAINPFSSQSARAVLMQGLSGALASARRAFSAAGPITFRFNVEPVRTATPTLPGEIPDAPEGLTPGGGRGGRRGRTGRSAAEREAEREAELRRDELDKARDLAIEIQNQTDALGRRLEVELESIGLSDRQRQLAEEVRQVDEKRRDDIVQIQQLQRLTAEEQAAAIAAINTAYAAQTAEIVEGNAQLYRRKSITEDIQNLNNNRRDIIRDYDFEISSIEAIARARKNGNDEDVRNAEERERILRRFADQRWALTKQINDSTDQEQIARLESQRTDILFLEQTELASLGRLQTKRAEIIEQQREFGFGLSEAMKRFGEEVNNQAAYAGRLFDTMAQGFTDSILRFVQTGKLSFKDLFRSLMTEIIKMQANKLFLSLFGKGGAMTSLFAGFFAQGGFIPGGMFGIAGESGPEIIRGPAYVTSATRTAQMMNAGNNMMPQETIVNYNINAVDARSFQQLVAQNPEFIYNVSQRGARRLPR
jgi:tape measure domain-containing protein